MKEEGIVARVVDMHTIKPLDEKLVLDCCAKTGAIVTIENHNIYNGLGSAVAEVIALGGCVPYGRIGLQDTFGESGETVDLFNKYGMGVQDIVKKARVVLAKKKRV